jgi:membrane-bound serine protease (ClpP class)
MEHKIVNDATAYLGALAELRGRSPAFAKRAVQEGASLSAQAALAEGVIDLMATDLPELLSRLDGRTVRTAQGERVLHTTGATVEVREADWRSQLLAYITDPNVAYLLMLLGVYGLIFELANPGLVLPGVVGAIALLLALYAFHVLPVNSAGLALMLLGIAFMVGEIFAPSFGALGIGGVIAFATGSLMLLERDVPGFELAWPLVAAVTLTTTAFFLGLVGYVVRLRHRPPVTGKEEIVGIRATVLPLAPDGVLRVRAHGELWAARAALPLDPGQEVVVTTLDGLTLVVEPVTATPPKP